MAAGLQFVRDMSVFQIDKMEAASPVGVRMAWIIARTCSMVAGRGFILSI